MTLRNRRTALLAWLPALLLVVPWALVACGGDDDGGGTGSDEAYVKDVCGAMSKFEEGLNDLLASSPSNASDIPKLTEDMAKLFNDVADDLDDANPPADAVDANDALVAYLRDAADTFKSGDLDAIGSLGNEPDFSLDADVEARLSDAAANVDDCKDVEIFGASS